MTSLAVRVFKAAATQPLSQLRKLAASLPAHCMIDQLAAKYLRQHRAHFGAAPTPGQMLNMNSRALSVALSSLAWSRQAASSKLVRIQNQDDLVPHTTAYSASPECVAIGRWLTNLIPGAQYPCRLCNGAYAVSRYHIARFSDAVVLLGFHYESAGHAMFVPQTDTAVDALVMNLVPEDKRQANTLEDHEWCPGILRPDPPVPPALAGIPALHRAPPATSPAARPPAHGRIRAGKPGPPPLVP